MPEPWIIRAARPDEAEAVLAFYDDVIDAMAGLAFHPKWQKGVYPEEEFLRASCVKGELYLTLDGKSGEILGAMVINRESNPGYAQARWLSAPDPAEVCGIHVLCVHPRVGRRGIGRRMVDEAIGICRRAGAASVRLDVIDGNLPAMRLYAAAGFAQTDTVQLFYEDTGWYTFHLFEFVLR